MIKIKILITAFLIIAISLTTYLYFKKQPVENVPNRATLVLHEFIILENEV